MTDATAAASAALRASLDLALKEALGRALPTLGTDTSSNAKPFWRWTSFELSPGKLSATLALGFAATSLEPALHQALEQAAKREAGLQAFELSFDRRPRAHAVKPGVSLLPGVRNLIAVASGKGGVGKSTTAANLALALAAEGASVGLLDADIYGPSQPMMMGVSGQPESADGRTMQPLVAHGVKVMSIGLLVAQDTAMVWRGPMATQALDQLLRQTDWGDLDHLIIDMPPGTGDIQLSLAQRVPLSGAVIVTTPQDIALLDALKGIKMFEKVGVPILGVVENMAVHVCSQCGHAEHIFGQEGGLRMAHTQGVPLLGSMPLALSIRQQADSGRPTVVAEPEGPLAQAYRLLALRTAQTLAQRAVDHSSKFPTITISSQS